MKRDLIDLRSNRAIEIQFKGKTLDEYWWAAMVVS